MIPHHHIHSLSKVKKIFYDACKNILVTLPIHNLTQSSRRAAGQRGGHKRYGRWRDGRSDNIHGEICHQHHKKISSPFQ